MMLIFEIKDFVKWYDGGFEVFKGVFLNIEVGEIFVLFGLNGVGKMILILIVCGIIMVIFGFVFVDGNDINENFCVVCMIIGLVL